VVLPKRTGGGRIGDYMLHVFCCTCLPISVLLSVQSYFFGEKCFIVLLSVLARNYAVVVVADAYF